MVEGFFKGRHIEMIKVTICDENVCGRRDIFEQILGDVKAPEIVINGDCCFVS